MSLNDSSKPVWVHKRRVKLILLLIIIIIIINFMQSFGVL